MNISQRQVLQDVHGTGMPIYEAQQCVHALKELVELNGEVRNVQRSSERKLRKHKVLERKCWICKCNGHVSSPCPSRYNAVGKDQKKNIAGPVLEVHEDPGAGEKPQEVENHRPVHASERTLDQVIKKTMGD